MVLEKEAESVTVPGSGGELTVLYNHAPLFTLLKEGVVTVRLGSDESFFSIGGGYLETNGREVNLLVSRAYGQDEIDEKEIAAARQKAESDLKTVKTDEERHEAMQTLRRSIIDLKVLKKRRRAS